MFFILVLCTLFMTAMLLYLKYFACIVPVLAVCWHYVSVYKTSPLHDSKHKHFLYRPMYKKIDAVVLHDKFVPDDVYLDKSSRFVCIHVYYGSHKVEHWLASRKWIGDDKTLDYLASHSYFAHDIAWKRNTGNPVFLYYTETFAFAQTKTYPGPLYKEEIGTLRTFLDEATRVGQLYINYINKMTFKSNNKSLGEFASLDYVATALPIEDIVDSQGDKVKNPLLADLEPLSQFKTQGPIAEVIVWISSAGSTSQMHYDITDNYYVQLLGTKKWTLYPPASHTSLHVTPAIMPNARHSQITMATLFGTDWTDTKSNTNSSTTLMTDEEQRNYATELDTFQHYQSGDTDAPYFFELEPGQVLFIPALWHHHVETGSKQGPLSVSVNLWSDGHEYASLFNLTHTALPFEGRWNLATSIIALRTYLHTLSRLYFEHVCEERLKDLTKPRSLHACDHDVLYAQTVLPFWRNMYQTRLKPLKAVFDVERDDQGRAESEVIQHVCTGDMGLQPPLAREATPGTTAFSVPTSTSSTAADARNKLNIMKHYLDKKSKHAKVTVQLGAMDIKESRGRNGREKDNAYMMGPDVNELLNQDLIDKMYKRARRLATEELGRVYDHGGGQLLLSSFAENCVNILLGHWNVDVFFASCMARASY